MGRGKWEGRWGKGERGRGKRKGEWKRGMRREKREGEG